MKEKYNPTPNIYPLPLGTSNKVYLTYDGKTLVTDFVKRLYQNTLQRNADSNGLSYWVDRLKNRTITAAQAVEGFFFSKEFLSANHNDAEFIHRCYITLLNRNEDASGKAYWLCRLQKDNNRKAMLKSFIESNEFTALVNQYGLVRGTIYVDQ
ncbi:MAG: DUF4214 domain-containing protein, partial [Solobacterium sp.]|nr:DUF4214 domain-containing protein [Solobacterium sp.]